MNGATRMRGRTEDIGYMEIITNHRISRGPLIEMLVREIVVKISFLGHAIAKVWLLEVELFELQLPFQLLLLKSRNNHLNPRFKNHIDPKFPS